jgi:hypothetical protein
MDQVLGVQTAGRLQGVDRLVAGDITRAGLLAEGWQPDDRARVALALSMVEGGASVSVEELAARLSSAEPRAGHRLIVRLLNYGVLRRVT